MELISELRVVQTGVQILFAFLLIVPFSNRFPSGNPFDRWVYVITLLLTGAAAGLLIAPPSHHRLLFRRNDKHYLVFTANQLMIAGLGCLALSITGGVLLLATCSSAPARPRYWPPACWPSSSCSGTAPAAASSQRPPVARRPAVPPRRPSPFSEVGEVRIASPLQATGGRS